MEKQLPKIGYNNIAYGIVAKLENDIKDSQMSPGSKTALLRFFKKKSDEIRFALIEKTREDLALWNEIISKANEIISINEDIEKLRAEKAELEQKFDSPKAREAFLLWQEYLKPFMDSPDSQLKRNAVLSAGRMVAAVFGYTEGYPQKQNGNLTE